MTKILIAEDERDIRDLVVFTLEFGGFEVVATGNGVELVNAAPTEKPDLILTDVRMPKMTGYEACQALKANPATKDIPVVFLSAKGQEAEVNAGLAAGGTAYILKPFAPDVLLTRVKEILKEHSKTEAKAQAEPEAKPVPVPDAKAATTPAAKPEAKPAAMPDAKAGGKPEAKPEAKVDTKAETKTEAKAEPKPDATSGAKPG